MIFTMYLRLLLTTPSRHLLNFHLQITEPVGAPTHGVVFRVSTWPIKYSGQTLLLVSRLIHPPKSSLHLSSILVREISISLES